MPDLGRANISPAPISNNMYNPECFYQTILTSGSVTPAFDLGGKVMAAIIVPGTIQGTVFTFQAADSNNNYFPVYDTAGNRLSAAYGTSRVITDIPELSPFRSFKIETSGTQTSDVVLGILTK